MKNIKSKLLAVLTIILLIVCIILPSMAETDNSILVLKQNENSYFIYIQKTLAKQFEFAFSNDKEETNLNYITSIHDKQGNNIAYINEEIKHTFFDNKANTYLWVKNEGTMVVEASSINLDSAITEDQLKSIEEITKKITVNSEAGSEKIAINGDTSLKYYWQIADVSSSEDYKNLVKLLNEISTYKDDTSNFTKIATYEEIYNLYNKLLKKLDSSKWIEAVNLEIEKPYDAKNEQQYILWIKDEQGKTDFQILTAYQKKVKEQEEKQVTVEVASKLPVTYDNSTILYIALAIVILAIIIMLVIRKKISDKNKRN